MSKYVVALFNANDGKLEQTLVEGRITELEAALRVLQKQGYAIPAADEYKLPEDLDELIDDCLNWELNLSVIEI